MFVPISTAQLTKQRATNRSYSTGNSHPQLGTHCNATQIKAAKRCADALYASAAASATLTKQQSAFEGGLFKALAVFTRVPLGQTQGVRPNCCGLVSVQVGKQHLQGLRSFGNQAFM
jgi:hypothetical protein